MAQDRVGLLEEVTTSSLDDIIAKEMKQYKADNYYN